MRMAASFEPAAFEANLVPPELIAVITEKVKLELVEHLKQTGGVDDYLKDSAQAPSNTYPSHSAKTTYHKQPSNTSSASSSPPIRTGFPQTSPEQQHSQAWHRPSNTAPTTASENSKRHSSSSSERASEETHAEQRPTAGRTFSTAELTTVDQAWGRLFDSEGHATPRLGQFLRGLANHIVNEFEPTSSIVITPVKMAKLYSTYCLGQEPNPLQSIFRAKDYNSLSRLYQDLECEHHFVQHRTTEAPSIPALTALGFAQWMTLSILAYPDEESKRLEQMVLALPIDADGDLVNGKPERLPKQISRHLLPNKEDRMVRVLFNTAISDFTDALDHSNRAKPTPSNPPLRRKASDAQVRPVEIHQADTTSTESRHQAFRQEHTQDNTVDSDAEPAAPISIERQRQPYVAQPGNGKVYIEDTTLNARRLDRTNLTKKPVTSNTTSDLQPPHNCNTGEPRRQRSKSNASQLNPQAHIPSRRRSTASRNGSPELKRDSDPTGIDITGTHYTYSSDPRGYNSSMPSTSSMSGSPPSDAHDRRGGRRGTTETETRCYNDFTSPRDAEKWDRYQEAAAAAQAQAQSVRDASSGWSHDASVSGSSNTRPRSMVAGDTRDAREGKDGREARDSRDIRDGDYEDRYRERDRDHGKCHIGSGSMTREKGYVN